MPNDMFNVKPVNESIEMDILNRLRSMNESTNLNTDLTKFLSKLADEFKKEFKSNPDVEGTSFSFYKKGKDEVEIQAIADSVNPGSRALSNYLDFLDDKGVEYKRLQKFDYYKGALNCTVYTTIKITDIKGEDVINESSEVNECDDAKKEVNEGTAFETKQQTDAMDDAKICPECFAEMSVVDNADLNYCPQCGTKLQMAEDNTIEEELDIALHEYVTYMRMGRVNEAMDVLRVNEATAVTDEDGEVYLEAYKTTVDADGTRKKVKIKTKKKKLTAKQKAALRKARAKAHKAGAEKARAKAMKVRKRLGL